MADTKSILELGIEAARAGDKAEARELFRLVTREKPDNAQGWLWLAGVAEDREEKRTALEQVIRLDPNNELARKGLAAMGGAAVGAATVTGVTAAAITPTTPMPATPAATTPVAASTDAPATTSATTTPSTTTSSTDDAWTPNFADDDFDLQDYQQTPRSDNDDEHPAVAVYDDPEEEEEPRRSGIGWLPWALGLVALALVAFLAFSFLTDRNNTAQNGNGVVAGTTTTASGTAVAGGVGDGTTTTATTGEGGGLPIEGSAVPGDTSVPVVPVVPGDTGATTLPGDTSVPVVPGDTSVPVVPGDTGATTLPADQTVIGGEQTAPPSDQAPAEQTAAPPEGAPAEEPTVIVVVPPDASVVPPVAEEPTAVPPTAEVVPPTTAPAPTTPTDLASANPAIVPPGTQIQAGAWTFVYNGAQTVIGGAVGNAPAPQGQYQVVIVNVINGSAQSAAIPDGLFALKDGQGRVYELNRAASVGYMDRFGRGVAADISPDDQATPGILTSVGMAFDVAPDATSLVLLSRANTNQGFQVR